MFLYGQTSKGGNQVYDIYNGKMPSLLSPEAGYQLWLEIKVQNSTHLVDALIEGNMRIAAAIAARYAQSLIWLKYDLYSEAMLALTAACNNVAKLEFENAKMLRGYLRKSIHGALSQFITSSTHGFKITSAQISRIRKGKDKQFKNLNELTSIKTVDTEDDENILQNVAVEKQREHLVDRMERLMKDAGLEDLEYQVLLFYMAGYTVDATAAQLGVSHGKVQYIKTEAIEKLKYIFFDPSVDLESIE